MADGWEERDEQSWKKKRWGGSWGGSWGGNGEQGGSGSSSSMQGGSWADSWGCLRWPAPPLAPAPPRAPAPPLAVPLAVATLHDAYVAGFSEGYRRGFQDGAKNGRPEPTALKKKRRTRRLLREERDGKFGGRRIHPSTRIRPRNPTITRGSSQQGRRSTRQKFKPNSAWPLSTP